MFFAVLNICFTLSAAKNLPNFHYLCATKNPHKDARGAGEYMTPWPNSQVPYQFDSSFTATDRLTFKKAADMIAAETCVSFVETSASKYLQVKRECPSGSGNGPNCFGGAYVDILGAGSPTTLTVGSPSLDPNDQLAVALLIHEIGHVLGLIHTQNRPDR